MKKLGKESFLIQLRNFGIGPIVGMFINLITVPITTRILLPEEFAKTSMYSLFQTLFYLICLLGCDQAYVRFYNEQRLSKKNLFINCVSIPLIFCVFLMLIISLFTKQISFFLFNDNEPLIMLMLILSLPLCVINRFTDLKIRMDMKGKIFSFLNIFSQVLNFGLLLFFLFIYEKSFRAIIFGSIFSSVIYTILSLILCGILKEKDKIHFDKEYIIEFIKYGIPLIFTSLLTWVMNSFDKVSLRAWSDFEQLGLYAAAFKIVGILKIVENIFTTTWAPVAYKWNEQKIEYKQFDKISTLLLAFMMIVYSLIIIFRNILLLYLGPEYRNTDKIFVFLLFVPVMFCISETTACGINFSKKTIYSLYVSIIVAVINIIGNYLLIPFFGALGAAISTAFSYLLFFWIRTFFSRRLWYKMNLIKYCINFIILIAFCINMVTFESKLLEIVLFILVLIYNFFLVKPYLKEFFVENKNQVEVENNG